MGLKCGAHGVKTWVKTNAPSAVRDFPSLEAARVASGHTAAQAAVLLDGNVLINTVPAAITTFDGYAELFGRFVGQGLAAADNVFVVWDEPQLVTRAKLEEQRRRDMNRERAAPVMSADVAIEQAPASDDYGLDTIERCNPHLLLKNRAARARFYDALCVRVMADVMARKWNANKMLCFDGIDPRGASRSPDSDRAPGMVSNVDKVEVLLTRDQGAAPIGEGDLKFPDLESEIQMLRNAGRHFLEVEVILVATIDTDSIAIELLHQTAKNDLRLHDQDQGTNHGRLMKSILCFREGTGKRKEGDDREVMYSCMDMELLHGAVVEKLFGDAKDVHSHAHKHAIALLACGWALCGCDFCELKGMRSDVVWDATVQIAQTHRRSLQDMDGVFSLSRSTPDVETAEARAAIVGVVRRLVSLATAKLEKMPRMQRACASAKLADEKGLKRAAWCAVYWAGLERKDLELWGFGSA